MAIFNKEYINEYSKINFNYNKSLYRISQKGDLDNKIIYPTIPDNYFTKNNYEDNFTKRICFSDAINKCLMALSMNCKDKEFYVYSPVKPYETYKPSIKEVPDSKITNEIWILKPVKLKLIGTIRCIEAIDNDGYEFSYGENYKATLYDWKYEWINKIK